MRTSVIFSHSSVLLLSLAFLTCATNAQDTPPPVPMFATNTSGFVQNGPNGANNLVLFTVPMPPEPDDDGNLPDPPPPIVQLDFAIIGDLSTGTDLNNDGVDDTLGNFAGLEWSSGIPGSGILIGSVLADDDGDGEIYTIVPETGETQLIGKAPGGLVRAIDLEASGSGYGSFVYGVTGGSGQNMSIAVTAGGSVQDVSVYNCGSGYQVNDIVTIAGGNFNATVRVTNVREQTGFADLAFNPTDGRMYGIVNDYFDNEGEIEFLPNTLWVDTNSDLVPDRKSGGSLLGLPGQFAIDEPAFLGAEVMQTLANGLAFDEDGNLFVYDNLAEEILLGGPGIQAEFPDGFGDLQTGVVNSGVEARSGLTVVNGDDLIIGIGTANNETLVNTFYIPDLGAPAAPDPEPPLYQVANFEMQFAQTDLFAVVGIGDLVAAQSNFDNAPETFPDNVIVLNGTPCKDAVLEALALSDDFRYCVFPDVPAEENDPPISIEFVYTIPNPGDLTALGVEFEMQTNVSNVGFFARAFNFNTQQYDLITFENGLSIGMDDTITVDYTFFGIDNYVDPNNGTMKCRLDAVLLGPVQVYPWQFKFDAVLAVFEY